jgi:hypothetical protein
MAEQEMMVRPCSTVVATDSSAVRLSSGQHDAGMAVRSPPRRHAGARCGRGREVANVQLRR